MPSGTFAAVFLAILMFSGSAPALAEVPPDPARTIMEAAVVDIPLLLEIADTSPREGMLWTSGDKPQDNLMARLSARPVQVASVRNAGAAGQPAPLLWRAIPGGKGVATHASALDLKAAPRMFCGGADQKAFLCWIDSDGDGAFDRTARARTERGSKPYHITLITGAHKLEAPQPYAILADNLRPIVPIEVRNCDKDYDRPRFSALSAEDGAVPVSYGEWHEKDSSLTFCRRASQIPPTAETAAQTPEGGYLAKIGPLTFAIGPKKNPAFRLIGLTDADALHRLESASLVAVAVGPTPDQAQLMGRQAFPYPPLMTEAGAIVHQGTLSAGQPLATIPFRHAYHGRLTQDVTINTLFGKRSVAAGTVLYGFPGHMRLTMTLNGMPHNGPTADSEFRDAGLELTWCTPVQGKAPAKEDLRSAGRNGWSAACIPYSTMGTHTVLTDLAPAFEITGIAYDAETASNDGRPPVERDDKAAFAEPLRVYYIYDGLDRRDISLIRRIYYGDSLTSETVMKVTPKGRHATVRIAGAEVEFSITDDAQLVVKQVSPPVAGVPPELAWDRTALLRAQLQKMGLTPKPPQAE